MLNQSLTLFGRGGAASWTGQYQLWCDIKDKTHLGSLTHTKNQHMKHLNYNYREAKAKSPVNNTSFRINSYSSTTKMNTSKK